MRDLLDEMKQVPPGYPFNQRLKSFGGVLYELRTDENFEIDYHVRHTVLPQPGDDQQLRDVVARIHAYLLDRDRPLWEFHLIEGLRGRRFALYVKVHHSIRITSYNVCYTKLLRNPSPLIQVVAVMRSRVYIVLLHSFTSGPRP